MAGPKGPSLSIAPDAFGAAALPASVRLVRGAGEPAARRQELQHGVDGLLAGHDRGVEHQVGVARFLVGIGHSGEARDQPGAGLGVQALAVARRADVHRGRDVDEQEVADLGDQLARGRARRGVRRDRRADRDAAMPGDLGRDVTDARDVEVPVGPGEGEPGGQQLPERGRRRAARPCGPPVRSAPRPARGRWWTCRTRTGR